MRKEPKVHLTNLPKVFKSRITILNVGLVQAYLVLYLWLTPTALFSYALIGLLFVDVFVLLMIYFARTRLLYKEVEKPYLRNGIVSKSVIFVVLLISFRFFLFCKPARNMMLWLASASGKEAAVNLLLKSDVNVNFMNKGTTPLINAIIRGNTSIVENLVAHGADISQRDSHNISPREFAEKLHLVRIGKVLDESRRPDL
jgi:hypothetical protein